MPQQKPIVVGGREFSVAHLAPMTIGCPCEEVGRNIIIRVAFSNHCYTESFDPERHDPAHIIFTEHDRSRVFCCVRHGLSFRLPGIVERLPGERVYQTNQQRNYVYAVQLEIDGQDYEVYLRLHREKMRDADLRMMIESAYPVDVPTIRPKRPNAIRFRVLAYKTLCGKQVRFAVR
jgi:hypothetical protein